MSRTCERKSFLFLSLNSGPSVLPWPKKSMFIHAQKLLSSLLSQNIFMLKCSLGIENIQCFIENILLLFFLVYILSFILYMKFLYINLWMPRRAIYFSIFNKYKKNKIWKIKSLLEKILLRKPKSAMRFLYKF